MNGVGKIAQFPCGRRTKWLVVVFWVVVLVVAGPLAGKLTGVQKNDAVEWLPQSAESTKVFKLSEQFGTADEAPAVVVYERPAGITPADLAAATADKAAFTQINGVVDEKVVGPIPAKDNKALELLVPIRMGTGGWQTLTDGRRSHAEAGCPARCRTVHAHRRTRRHGRRVRRGVQGHRRDAAVLGSRGRHHHLAADLPQPDPLAVPGHLGGCCAGQCGGRHLPAGPARRADGQRAERRRTHRAGVRRRHRLCAVAGGALSGRAAPPRGSARGDGVRAAPRRARRSSRVPRP